MRNAHPFRGGGTRSTSSAPGTPALDDDVDDLRLIDLDDVPSRWPTLDGMVSPAPHAWRYEFAADRLAVVDAFYRDLLWNVQLELDGVDWPGRSPRGEVSIVAACRDVARLWHLPSADESLPSTSTARRARIARRREPKGPGRTPA